MARANHKTSIEVFAENVSGDHAPLRDGEGADFLIGEVSYSKGGMNYFTGNHSKRGYRISVQMRQRGACFESFVIGDNIGQGEFLCEAHAFSAKKLEELSKDPMVLAKLNDLKNIVLPLYKARQAAKLAVRDYQAAV